MSDTLKIVIGRTNGPCTDIECEAEIKPEELELIKDVLMMVNRASNNKESWYVRTEAEGIIIPV